jgi:hypothetical protein
LAGKIFTRRLRVSRGQSLGGLSTRHLHLVVPVGHFDHPVVDTGETTKSAGRDGLAVRCRGRGRSRRRRASSPSRRRAAAMASIAPGTVMVIARGDPPATRAAHVDDGVGYRRGYGDDRPVRSHRGPRRAASSQPGTVSPPSMVRTGGARTESPCGERRHDPAHVVGVPQRRSSVNPPSMRASYLSLTPASPYPHLRSRAAPRRRRSPPAETARPVGGCHRQPCLADAVLGDSSTPGRH